MHRLLAWLLLLFVVGSCVGISPTWAGYVLGEVIRFPLFWSHVAAFGIGGAVTWTIGYGVLAREIRDAAVRSADQALEQRQARVPIPFRWFV